MSLNNTETELKPRLCHLTKWPDFQGYGFNLHAEKGKAGQYIGKVDAGSPAQAAGLKEGDRIVEVNGTNIGNENHQQVVARIKAGGEETRLLVVDSETDQHYKNEKTVVTGSLTEVVFLSSARDDLEPSSQAEEVPPSYTAAVTPTEEITSTQVNDVQSSVATTTVTSNQFKPRLCHIKKRPDFNGYGFNLHAERDKPGQFIGKTDDDSPAQAANLREGDRIIEVNGTNVEAEGHAHVINLIKSGGDETRLLVVDKPSDEYYKSQGITVTSSMGEVEHKSSVPEEGHEEISAVVETPPVFHIPPPPTDLPPPEDEDDFNAQDFDNVGADYETTQETVVEATQAAEVESEVALPEETSYEEERNINQEVEQITAEVAQSVETVPDISAADDAPPSDDVGQIESEPVQITENEIIENVENEIEVAQSTEIEVTENEVAPAAEIEVAPAAEIEVAPVSEVEVTPVSELEAVNNVESAEENVESNITEIDQNVSPQVEEHVQEEVEATTETVNDAATAVNGQTTTTVTETVTTYSAPEPTPEPVVPESPSEPPKQANGNTDIFGGLSAKEMKERLRSKKKVDPRTQHVGFSEKHKMFERL